MTPKATPDKLFLWDFCDGDDDDDDDDDDNDNETDLSMSHFCSSHLITVNFIEFRCRFWPAKARLPGLKVTLLV